ncbi:MAG: sugar ABC transporter substrate-binding protein [Candidatus Paceibacterota bacterium]
MDQIENKKNISIVGGEKGSGSKKRYIMVSFALIIAILFVGTYFYFQNSFNLDNVVKENNNAITNNTEAYKKIAYVGFGTSGQPFWVAMGKFSEEAALARKIIFMDLTSEIASPDAQIASLNLAIDQHVDGIILGANLPSTLLTVLDRAYKANIPVVAIDTAVDSPAIVSFIATDNLENARVAGDFIVNATKAKGTVLILCGEKTHPNSIASEKGVREKAEKAGMNVISRYADWQIEKAYQYANEELSKPNNITAIFGCWDPGIISAEKAVEDKGLQGKIILIGFDGLQEAFKDIQAGKILAVVAQPIKQEAIAGVETIMDYLNKKTVEKIKLIPGILVNKTNVGYFLD